MNLFILIFILSLVAACLGAPVFEFVFLVFLGTPIIAWLASYVTGMPLTVWTYLPLLAALGLIFIAMMQRKIPVFQTPKAWSPEYAPVAVFLAAYAVAWFFCMQWPDFVSIGERLRDYSLLASNINFPLEAREPWLAGENLNYYLYWYRFGQMLSALFHWPTWQVYHALSAFSISLYLAATFRVLQRYLGFSWKAALFCAVITAYGSNVDGVINFLNQDQNWWGPSRVIQGAINEFPAWSFLLGDIHPHYLNLSLVPLFICWIFLLAGSTARLDLYLLTGLAAASVGTLWIWNANAWEVPMFGIVLLCFFVCALIETFQRLRLSGFTGWTFEPKKDLLARHLPGVILIVLACISLYLSSRNIKPLGYPWMLVDDPGHPTPRTITSELLNHWGIPFSLIALSQIFYWRSVAARLGTAAVLLLSLFAARYGVCFLSALLILAAARTIKDMREAGSSGQSNWPKVLLNGIGLAAIVLIMIPEFVYLDDPYGDDVQRMNTIFKVYSAAWFLIHVYAFGVARESLAFVFEYLKKLVPPVLIYTSCLGLSLAFFSHGASLRKQSNFTVLPRAQGLSSLDQQWNGAGRAIKALEKASQGIVLEAQEGAYNYSSHVSTLASKEAYLGWTNHVDLLTRKTDESRRRQEFIVKMYEEKECNDRKAALQEEKISYMVVGPLEKQRFPSAGSLDFSCMATLARAGEYVIYKTGLAVSPSK